MAIYLQKKPARPSSQKGIKKPRQLSLPGLVVMFYLISQVSEPRISLSKSPSPFPKAAFNCSFIKSS